MHSKTQHKFFSSMSNDPPEPFLIKDDSEEDSTNFEIVKRIETVSSSSKSQYSSQHKKEEENNSNHQEEIEESQICRIVAPKHADSELTTHSSQEKLEVEEEEEEDGFKTPTSLDHKISVTQCPPAPRKTKPSLKRKASSYNNNNNYNHCHCRRNPLDLSKEVELLLFPTQRFHPLSDSQQTTKKVRREQHK